MAPISAWRGPIVMWISCLLLALMSLTVRLAKEVDVAVLAGGRFALGALAVFLLAGCGVANLRTGDWRWLVGRGLFGGASVYVFYQSIHHSGLAKGTVLLYTYPLWAPLFGYLLLGEAPSRASLTALPVALAGIYLVAARQGWGAPSWWDLVGLLGGLLAAVAVVCIRRLRATDSSYVIFLSQCLFGLPVIAPGILRADWRLSSFEWLIVVAGAAAATAGQLTMTYAFRYVTAAEGSLLSLLTPVFAILFGVLLFHEHLPPTQWVGCALVMGATAWVSAAGAPKPAGKSAVEVSRDE